MKMIGKVFVNKKDLNETFKGLKLTKEEAGKVLVDVNMNLCSIYDCAGKQCAASSS